MIYRGLTFRTVVLWPTVAALSAGIPSRPFVRLCRPLRRRELSKKSCQLELLAVRSRTAIGKW